MAAIAEPPYPAFSPQAFSQPPEVSRPVVRLGRVPFPFLTLTAIGALFWYPLNIVGTMYAIEVVLAMIGVAGLVFSAQDAGFAPRTFQKFFALLLLSFVAYVTADLLHGTPMHDALRAWARTGFLGLDTLGVWALCRKSMANLLPLFVGIFVGYMLVEYRIPAATALYWKFGLGTALTGALLALIATFAGSRAVLFAALLTGGLAMVSFVFDSRAMGGVLALTAAFVLMKVFVPAHMRRMIPIFVVITIPLAGAMIYLVDEHFASGRRDSVATIERAVAVITAVQTIAEHPLDGVGSWNENFEAANRHRANALRFGLRQDQETYRNQLGHSAILQPWVEAGMFAALFFLYYFWRLIQSLRWMLLRPLDRYTSLLLFYLVSELWDAAFSPFLGFHRMFMAIAVVICIMLAKEKAAAKFAGQPAAAVSGAYAGVAAPLRVASE